MRSWDEYKTTMTTPVGLWDAARANDTVELERLIAAGLDLEAKDSRGYSALMLAVYVGNLEATQLLLARGASPNSIDAAGNTTLMGASFKGHLKIVEALLDAGADLRSRNQSGADALQFATMFGRVEVVALLETRKAQGDRK
jgi:ankyrin repeat protein